MSAKPSPSVGRHVLHHWVTVWRNVLSARFSYNSSVVEGEHGCDGGEPDAGDEERVPDLGLVVALQGKGVTYRGLE